MHLDNGQILQSVQPHTLIMMGQHQRRHAANTNYWYCWSSAYPQKIDWHQSDLQRTGCGPKSVSGSVLTLHVTNFCPVLWTYKNSAKAGEPSLGVLNKAIDGEAMLTPVMVDDCCCYNIIIVHICTNNQRSLLTTEDVAKCSQQSITTVTC